MKDLVQFKTLVFVSAMFITACAAVFSVTGIGKLFAGAALSAMIMASALEFGKIVSISFLYRYWKEMNRALKIYLVTSSMVLMVITSAGIYGYLSSAYAKVAVGPLKTTAEISTLTSRAQTVDQDINRKTTRLTQLNELRTQQENRLDNLISKSVAGTNTTIKTAQSQMAQYDKDVRDLQTNITKLSEIRDSLTSVKSVKEVEINSNSDIGTFVYIAKIFNLPLDTIVKWFTFIIVLVFDPLAVALIIGFNFLVKKDELTPIITPNTPITITNTPPHPITPNIDAVNTPEPIIASPDPTPAQVDTRRTDAQYFTRGDFDWSKTDSWQSDPKAVDYYNYRIKNQT
jgi:hypothetical protein